VSDPWEDEGFGGEDDWDAPESLESNLEDDETEVGGLADEDEGDDELDPDS
jgi:hypothetical protein